jgi:hypothetical protein
LKKSISSEKGRNSCFRDGSFPAAESLVVGQDAVKDAAVENETQAVDLSATLQLNVVDQIRAEAVFDGLLTSMRCQSFYYENGNKTKQGTLGSAKIHMSLILRVMVGIARFAVGILGEM